MFEKILAKDENTLPQMIIMEKSFLEIKLNTGNINSVLQMLISPCRVFHNFLKLIYTYNLYSTNILKGKI